MTSGSEVMPRKKVDTPGLSIEFLRYLYFTNFLKKYFYLYLNLRNEKTVILNTNTFYFKKLSLYEVYF